jgi:hypothetical protein
MVHVQSKRFPPETLDVDDALLVKEVAREVELCFVTAALDGQLVALLEAVVDDLVLPVG